MMVLLIDIVDLIACCTLAE